MTSKYRLKLFFVLLAFAFIVAFTIATIDYLRLKQQTLADNEFQMEQATETVKYALKTIDKAFYFLDTETAEKMEEHTNYLQKKYDQNPNFATWDFKSLSKEIDMDIYILNDKNKIIYSNVDEEVGVDFSVCCYSLNKILNKRRASGELFIDGIDLDQQSGKAKKFSYMATKDKQFMIELGYELEQEAIFQEFNFLKVADELVEDFSLIEGIRILNFGGLPFGMVSDDTYTPERRKSFEQARETNEIVEMNGELNGEKVIYRYVPYQSTYDTGSTTIKVVEMVYNNHQRDALLHENLKVYIGQLFIILVGTIIVSSFIANWFAKPVYLAFHDSLTGLKNRAAFNDRLQESLLDSDLETALLMMDLDNFKLVNDYLGHGKGDYLLHLIGQTMDKAAGKEFDTFRLGGDEFAVIMPNTNQEQAVMTAKNIIKSLTEVMKREKEINTLSVSVSVGIAVSTVDDTETSLFKKADIAMYESKEKGKNQYQVFTGGSEPNIPFTS